jgi:hypothetical protein
MKPVPVLKALCRYFRFSCGQDALYSIHNIVLRATRARACITNCVRPFGHRSPYFAEFDMMSSSQGCLRVETDGDIGFDDLSYLPR